MLKFETNQIDPEVNQSDEEKTETKPVKPKREIPSGCPKYLGYLGVSKDSIILMECLTCPEMTTCMLKKD
ncbi:MAG: hypothetical protein P8X91_02670 [Candidatus Bathyarchaeota archaeon]